MEIIKLDPSKQNFSIKKVNKSYCSHAQVEVDEQEREVRCASCNTVIDPFEFIYGVATTVENHCSYMLMLKNEVFELEQKKDRLKREIVNLGSQVKRRS